MVHVVVRIVRILALLQRKTLFETKNRTLKCLKWLYSSVRSLSKSYLVTLAKIQDTPACEVAMSHSRCNLSFDLIGEHQNKRLCHGNRFVAHVRKRLFSEGEKRRPEIRSAVRGLRLRSFNVWIGVLMGWTWTTCWGNLKAEIFVFWVLFDTYKAVGSGCLLFSSPYELKMAEKRIIKSEME